MASIAIIGAGISGLAAAHVLRDHNHQVTLFEKSLAAGGRAATKARAGFINDDGAQYIKGGSPLSSSWITQRFYVDDLIDIQKPVWVFDQHGIIQEGDPAQNADAKWTYRYGLVTFAKQMAAGLNVHFAADISHIRQERSDWSLFGANERSFGSYDGVVIAIPAPQAVELIAASSLSQDLQALMIEKLGQAAYNPLISVALGYHDRPQPRPFYALVNTDKAHAISWLAWEHEKASERVPDNAGLLIAQMAPQYSREHWETPSDELLSDVVSRVATLLDEPLVDPIFTDISYWQYALPSAKADAHTLNEVTIPAALAFCGDAFTGGRVHLALEQAIEVAGKLSRAL
jgi:renalase